MNRIQNLLLHILISLKLAVLFGKTAIQPHVKIELRFDSGNIEGNVEVLGLS
jgi:hypothetical protein